MKYDTIVYIGRFRPCHLAHIETMKRGLELGKRLIVLVGSAGQPRTTKNPWNVSEVEQMIRAALPVELHSRLLVMPLRDIAYNDQAWVQQVQNVVRSVTHGDDRVGIIGYSKDESSYYLQMFPQWGTIEVENIDDIHATDIRNALFDCDGDVTGFDLTIGRNLPSSIHEFLKAFTLTEEYGALVREHLFLKQHHKMWENSPYPVTFVTCDAIVIQAGHVLLVRRRAEPGRNLWAMPGGYLNSSERIVDGIIRELREETKIKVPEPVLRGSVKHMGVYDDPSRSLRGRIITHVALIELPPGELPRVKGGDDAEKARWVPLSTFERMEDQMFEDHFGIIKDMLGRM